MEVTYTTTMDDFVAFNLYTLTRSPSAVRQQRFTWLGFGLFAWVLAAACWVFDFPTQATQFGFLGASWLVSRPLIYRWSITRGLRKIARERFHDDPDRQTTLVLTEESLTQRTEATQLSVRWQTMAGVVVVGEVTYVYFTRDAGVIIPRHGFKRPEDYDVVQEFVFSKLGKPA